MNQQLIQLLVFTIISIVQCDHLKIQKAAKDVFGFTNFVSETVYKQYDLEKISVLVFLDNNVDQKFIDYAQTYNVKTYLTGRYPAEKLDDNEFRGVWFKNISKILIEHKMNGLNLDFNEPISKMDPKRNQLTNLVKFLSQSLFDQHTEFSMTVPWSPINKNGTATNGQDYDYPEIVQHLDYLLVQSFHINSQIFVGSEYDDEVCLAKSNNGFFDSAAGLMKWISINETDNQKYNSDDLMDFFNNDLANNLNDELNLRNKIVLVYPWFGLDYTCEARVERQRCLIRAVPFIDSNCSDKIAREVQFKDIIKRMIDQKLALFYDPHSRSTYLEFSDNTHVHQLWFDYYYDYSLKYLYPSQFDLRGMGIYRLDYLDYSDANKDTSTIWQMVPKYK